MSPDRFPLLPRLVVFGFAVSVILWLSLVPTEALPAVTFWDKAEHALAYFALGGLGLVLFPRRGALVVGFVLALGIGVEVLQATMGQGRQGDWRDVAANALGLAAAALVVAVGRRALRGPD